MPKSSDKYFVNIPSIITELKDIEISALIIKLKLSYGFSFF